MFRFWIAFGALNGLAAVALSAFAAHAGPRLTNPAALQQGLTMQGWHALALLGLGLWAERHASLCTTLAGAAFALGVTLFCAGVYASALGGVSLGPVAPIGGSLLMLGWLLLAISAVFAR